MPRGFGQTQAQGDGRFVVLLGAQQVQFNPVIPELFALTVPLVSLIKGYLGLGLTPAHGEHNRQRVEHLICFQRG
jgi:hypothetical protein